MRKIQKEEALKRMKKLNLLGEVRNHFRIYEKVFLSEKGIIWELDEMETKMVREWENNTGNLVYHVIKTNMEFGLCYSFLYVSKHTEKWQMDNEDLGNGYPFVYVKNMDCDCFSEYGSIGIAPIWGGLIRTA